MAPRSDQFSQPPDDLGRYLAAAPTHAPEPSLVNMREAGGGSLANLQFGAQRGEFGWGNQRALPRVPRLRNAHRIRHRHPTQRDPRVRTDPPGSTPWSGGRSRAGRASGRSRGHREPVAASTAAHHIAVLSVCDEPWRLTRKLKSCAEGTCAGLGYADLKPLATLLSDRRAGGATATMCP